MRSLVHRPLLLLVVFAALAVSAEPEPEPVAEPEAEARPSAGGRRQTFPPGLAEVRLIVERAEEIGVSEETVKKAEALMTEVREKEEELRGKTTAASNKTRSLLDENLPSEEALMAAAKAAAEITWETRELRLRCSLQARALLTKEQLQKFMEIREKAMTSRRKGGRRPRR